VPHLWDLSKPPYTCTQSTRSSLVATPISKKNSKTFVNLNHQNENPISYLFLQKLLLSFFFGCVHHHKKMKANIVVMQGHCKIAFDK
jgi:hypothetical protein